MVQQATFQELKHHSERETNGTIEKSCILIKIISLHDEKLGISYKTEYGVFHGAF